MNQELFESGAIVGDADTFSVMNVEDFREAYREYAEMIQFFQAIESGFISLSLSDYLSLPAVTIPIWNIYKAEIYKKQKVDKEKIEEKLRNVNGPK